MNYFVDENGNRYIGHADRLYQVENYMNDQPFGGILENSFEGRWLHAFASRPRVYSSRIFDFVEDGVWPYKFPPILHGPRNSIRIKKASFLDAGDNRDPELAKKIRLRILISYMKTELDKSDAYINSLFYSSNQLVRLIVRLSGFSLSALEYVFKDLYQGVPEVTDLQEAINVPQAQAQASRYDLAESRCCEEEYRRLSIVVREEAMSYMKLQADSNTAGDFRAFTQLISKVKEDGVGVIWDQIKGSVTDRMFGEFGSLSSYQDGTGQAFFIDLIKEGQNTQLDDLSIFQETVQSSKGYYEFCSEMLRQSSIFVSHKTSAEYHSNRHNSPEDHRAYDQQFGSVLRNRPKGSV